jgi:hypothetical protein
MKKPERYVRQKFIDAMGAMSGNEAFPRRVMKAWNEIYVLTAEDFDDDELREHYEFILGHRIKADSSEAESEEVRKRIVRIFLELEARSLVPDVPRKI